MKHKTKITVASIAGLVAVGGFAFAAQGYQARKEMHRAFAPEKIMERIDSDGDMAFSREEMTALAADYFSKADEDGNGRLSKAEIITAIDSSQLPSRLKKRSGRLADRLMGQGDVNQDGFLAEEEINNRMAKFHALADWNDDGKVEMAEAKRLRQGFGNRRHRDKQQ